MSALRAFLSRGESAHVLGLCCSSQVRPGRNLATGTRGGIPKAAKLRVAVAYGEQFREVEEARDGEIHEILYLRLRRSRLALGNRRDGFAVDAEWLVGLVTA